MRPELQAKLLQHLNKKKADEGFTLVELLVVVIIIGILAAIALPSYLNLTATSKQSEGKQNIASLIHAQQAWATENPTFATSFDLLATGVVKGAGSIDSTTSSIYTYEMPVPAPISPAGDTIVTMTGTARIDTKLRGYSGGVNTYFNAAGQQTWGSAVCEAAIVGTATPGAPIVSPAAKPAVDFAATGGGTKAKVQHDVECLLAQNEARPAGK